jgi:ribonuclease T1
MSRVLRIALIVIAALALFEFWPGHRDASPGLAGATAGRQAPPAAGVSGSRYPAFLPPEAATTLEAIEQGGPFPYPRDGVVFENREHRLPERSRGYYHEYTVTTPGSADRGARRIITGGRPPEVYYYTDDHYRSFRRLEIKR